jgi:hypothetical protein
VHDSQHRKPSGGSGGSSTSDLTAELKALGIDLDEPTKPLPPSKDTP